MFIKMLSTRRGCLNNGCGNISMDYLSGGVYDAPPEDAETWIESGDAEPAEAVINIPAEAQMADTPDVSKALPKEKKAATAKKDLESLGAKYGKKRR